MRTTKVQRITALLLVLVLLLGSTVAVSASNGKKDDEDNALNSIKELLNAISYNEYQNLELFTEAVNGTEEIVIPGTSAAYTNTAGLPVESGDLVEIEKDNRDEYKSEKDAWTAAIGLGGTTAEDKENAAKPHKVKVDGIEGLYIPDSGTVTWTISGIDQATKYNLKIEYYPVSNKSASVERIFMINGEVPFAEARYLDMSKIWTTNYPDALIEVGKNDPDELLVEAQKGFENAKLTDDKKYIQCTKPDVWTEAMSAFVDTYSVRFFEADIDKNEIRESLQSSPEWSEYTVKDSNGFTQEPFVFVMKPDEKTGNVTISLEGVNEPVVISNIILTPCKTYDTYEQYLEKLVAMGVDIKDKGDGVIKLESEYFSAVSDQTIYPVADTTSALNSPVATDRTLLNVVGGGKWQNVGQWIEYDFTVSDSGMYSMLMRYKQNILDGMSVCRTLYLYSGEGVEPGEAGYYDGIPFDEAARLKFNFGDDWDITGATDGDTDFEFYFKEGVTYTLRLEVSLGSMGEIVRRVQEALDAINADYLNILKLTGTSPDEFRDYDFYRTIPDTMGDMYQQHVAIAGTNEDKNYDGEYAEGSIVDELLKDSSKSSMTATLVNVADLLKEMSSDQEQVAKNMEQLKTYIGSMGTWLGDAKTQPLLLDYILIQSSEKEVPKAKANIFQAVWHEFSGFVQSFFRNYDRMGATVDTENTESVEVWLAYGRDQSQVIRNLINNDFSSQLTDDGESITVNLKLVAGGTLLPSILSGQGPDVYLGLGSGDVINYAIRGALEPLNDLSGYDELRNNDTYFTEEAMMVLEIESVQKDENGEVILDEFGDPKLEMQGYGLPETQGFAMMFVREDILADLNLKVPETWDDVRAAIPVLQANNMEIALSTDSNIFIYQMGGELFADGGMRINLDSNLALTAFNDMCEFFTMYSFPYEYNFANRFRTGEMPIGFADYTGTYNHLKVFATEIEGLWSFYPLPGIRDENGDINNDAVAGVSAVVMITDCEQRENAWEFMKWYVGEDCQIDYSNEMVAILGPSAKHATANKVALKSLPWTQSELKQIEAQFDNLAAIPNYPGAYIVGRYTNFAFLDAYNDNANPVESLLGYIDYINDEITRKRDEFGLETLDKTKKQTTLAIKRMQQAEEALEEIKSDSAYSSAYDATYDEIMKEIRDYETEDYVALRGFAKDLEALNKDLFAKPIKYLNDAADCLVSYEAYK